ncbi:MAG: hypothetical protein WBO73_05045 [Gammaproteobacteria bacterium]
MSRKNYCGIHNDHFGGMTPIGTVIRDAWVFGIIPETETCENWDQGQMQLIQEQTRAEWDKYGCLVSNLPDDIKQRHAEIHSRAISKAKAQGWDPADDYGE